MSGQSSDINMAANERVKEILEVVMSYARLDFSKKTSVLGNHDELDAIGAGVNMLGEELQSSTISLKEKERLLKEIHHRVKNNLQIVSSLLRLQSEKIPDQSYLQLIAESQNRIASMALVHEMLYSSSDLSRIEMNQYIQRLTHSIHQSFFRPGMDVGFDHDIDPQLFFNIDLIVPLGLILNEIVSNSFKYAFPENKGKINIRLYKSEKSYHLCIQDNGKGFNSEMGTEMNKHLGMQLIYMLAEQLNGSVALETSHGFCYDITFTD